MKIELQECKYSHNIEISQVLTGTYNYRMCCSIFASYVNLYNNTSYSMNPSGTIRRVEQVYKDIDKAIAVCIGKGTLNIKTGGYYDKNRDEVGKIQMANKIEFTKDEMFPVLELGYAVQVNVSVNRKFVNDLKDDGKINGAFEVFEYLQNPTYAHTFNLKKVGDHFYVLDTVYPVINNKLVEGDFERFYGIIGNNCASFI